MLKVVTYKPEYKDYFYKINHEWVSSMFKVEEVDEQVMSNPKEEILDKGGEILFVLDEKNNQPIGTAALMPDNEGGVELTKMGVFASARGLGAGKVILNAAIKKGTQMSPDRLYLLTNKKCESAIHLYLKNGFKHSEDIMKSKGGNYERCDVAMIYTGAKN